jgi:hypothetical protein
MSMNSSIINFSERLRPRTYAIAAMAAGVLWLVATMAANILIDPQGVFGIGPPHEQVDPNGRYQRYREYEAQADQYDAVLFASSRGIGFDRDLLAKLLGVRAVANFSVPLGLLTDHLPVLQFLIHDKAARGQRLAAAFLVIDPDFFGLPPWTNSNIDAFLPPQISGENRLRFWWRYLTVFQYSNWRLGFWSTLQGYRQTRWVTRSQPRFAVAAMPVSLNLAFGQPLSHTVPLEGADAIQIRTDLTHQLALLAQFAALCKANDVRLTVMLSPLNRHSEWAGDAQTPDNERIAALIANVVPVWDFDRPEWLSARQDLWLHSNDRSHYTVEVGNMMLHRIFGGETNAPADFGQLRTP